MATYDEPTDPKVPVLRCTGGHEEVREWAKLARAYYRTLGKEDRKSGVCGSKLWLNLRGEARRLAEDFDIKELDDDSEASEVSEEDESLRGDGHRNNKVR